MARLKPSSLRTLLVALSLCVSAAEGAAQSVGRMAFEDVANAARDFGAIWVAPFRGSPQDYLMAGGVLAVGAAVSPLDDNVDRWMFAHEDRGFLDALSPIRRGGDFYSLNKAAPYVGG